MTKSNEIPKEPIELNWDDDIHDEDPTPAEPLSMPEHEPLPNKGLKILNNTAHNIRFLRLGSDWQTVNFAIESEDTTKHDRIPRKQRKILAEDLFPGDTIELKFHPPELIEK